MEKKNTYTSFFNAENQAVYRDKLAEIMTKTARSKQDIANEIGVSVITLRKFILKDELVRPVSFTRIVAFVNGYND